jgi:hypothetical protein
VNSIEKMRKNQKHTIITFGIITALILISTVCVWPALRLNSFYEAEANTVTKFDTLNNELLATIPVPSGVVELEQSRNGIVTLSTEHGRYLRTKYNISHSHPDIVLEHYEKFFMSNEWKETIAYEGFYSVHKGTACVDIHFFGDNYSLNIWHDFWNQGFSPSNPHTKLMGFIEFGESSFAVCPP